MPGRCCIFWRVFLLLLCAGALTRGVAVERVRPTGRDAGGFTAVAARASGVTFSNLVPERIIPANQNLLLGSGVAAGDFDGDGWCDLFFSALHRGNALYRNRGGWRFEEVTEPAGVALRGRTNTGAVFADVDGDGDLDLLVSSLGDGVRLLLNGPNGGFRDATAASGLASRAGALSMTLGDVDGDGDLDLFVCNYGAVALAKSGVLLDLRVVNGRPQLRGAASDRLKIVDGRLIELGEPSVLYLNEGRGVFRAASWNSTRFLDEDGRPMPAPWDFSLSAQMRDLNGDGAPDLYVCNDFDTPDRFWLNDGRGNFRLAPRAALRVQSYAAMGVDFADLDHDGHPDFFVAEMRAVERARRLWQLNPLVSFGAAPAHWSHRPEVPRNTLFRARGDGSFEEIARAAGVAASDWSWQGAFLDADLDGHEDLLVANGHWFDVQDLDVPPPASGRTEDLHAQLLRSPPLFTPNRAWRNRGDLTFEDHSARWNFDSTNVCHGFALADLDNDGDLDVAANAFNAPALLLRNDAARPRVSVCLRGAAPNTAGVGARVTLRGGAVPVQTQEIIAGGKYLSGDEARRVFAASARPMELEVTWRSGARTLLTNVLPDARYEISEAGAVTPPAPKPAPHIPTLFTDESHRLKHTHADPPFDDFALQPLLPRQLSQRGPGLAVIDLDGDGHDDLVIGAGRGGRVEFHRGDGRGGFALAARSEPVPDDVLALAAWTSAPGQRALLVTLAGHENAANHPPLLELVLEKDELVFNTVADPAALPSARSVGHGLAVADFDGDGDLDVFLGGHAVPGRYPEAAPSVLLRNQDGGLSPDATNRAALRDVGLVNSALWSDLDQDGWPELVLACEWGPVRLFKNQRGSLSGWNPKITVTDSRTTHHAPRPLNSQPSTLNQLPGWWTGLAAADFDQDGRLDLAVGNWGLNGDEHATPTQPLQLYYADCLRRGALDLFEADYDGPGVEPRPARALSELAASVPVLLERFRTHRDWAAAALPVALEKFPARSVQASTLAAAVLLNRGEHFEFRPLPPVAQLAPVWGVVARDFDGDGLEDLFLAQNFSAMRAGTGPLNSGRGQWLRGDGAGNFEAVTGARSGITVNGDQRGAAAGDFDEDGRMDLVVSQNADATRLLRNATATPGLRLRLDGGRLNPAGIGASVRVEAGGKLQRVLEPHGGGGWISQDSSTFCVPVSLATNAECHVLWPGGKKTVTPIPAGTRALTIRVPKP